MNLIGIILIGIALSMDALAVSIATGASLKENKVSEAFKMAGAFGVFQALMPILGAMAGIRFKDAILAWDHWIAFIILSIIGVKMIYEAHFIEEEEKKKAGKLPIKTLLILSIATSIDALAVGFSISLIGGEIFAAASIIGLVTFFICFTGVFIGEKIGHFLEDKIESFGGLILILVGLKILFSHI